MKLSSWQSGLWGWKSFENPAGKYYHQKPSNGCLALLVGTQDSRHPLTQQLRQTLFWWAMASSTLLKVWKFSPFFISSVFGNQLGWRKDFQGQSLTQGRWVWVTGPCAAFSCAYLHTKQVVVPTHVQWVCYLRTGVPPSHLCIISASPEKVWRI